MLYVLMVYIVSICLLTHFFTVCFKDLESQCNSYENIVITKTSHELFDKVQPEIEETDNYLLFRRQ